MSKPLPVTNIVVCLLLEALETHVIGRYNMSVFLGVTQDQKELKLTKNCYLDMKHKTLVKTPPHCLYY